MIQEMLEFVGYVWGKFGLATVSLHFVKFICSDKAEKANTQNTRDMSTFNFAFVEYCHDNWKNTIHTLQSATVFQIDFISSITPALVSK